jgi:hypothetical protein
MSKSIHKKNSDRILSVSPKIDLDDIKVKAKSLKSKCNSLISDLKGTDYEHHKYLSENAYLLYNTKFYKEFIEVIHSVFADVHSYLPNTVGSFYNGCSVGSNLDVGHGCSVICAGSIPIYTSNEWDISMSSKDSFDAVSNVSTDCKYLVMHLEWNEKNKSFDISDLNDSTHKEKTIMYTSFDEKSFPGFSEAEKEAFEKYGIHKVKLIQYNPKNNSLYTNITDDFVKLKSCKVRKCGDNNGGDNGGGNKPDVPDPNPAPSSSSYNWIWAVLIILVIILIIYFLLNKSK